LLPGKTTTPNFIGEISLASVEGQPCPPIPANGACCGVSAFIQRRAPVPANGACRAVSAARLPVPGDDRGFSLLRGNRGSGSGGGSRLRFAAAGAPLLDGRHPVALLEGGYHDWGDEFLLPKIVELDDYALFVAGKNRTETKLQVLYLSALWISCSNTHR